MAKTTQVQAKTSTLTAPMDTLTEVMDSLRIRGSILLLEDYAPPWGIVIPRAKQLGRLLKLAPGVRAVDFHFVQRGHIVVTIGNENEPLIVEAGELVICFTEKDHCISQGKPAQAVGVETLLNTRDNVFQVDDSTRAQSASIICGVFLVHDVDLSPLYAALPPFVHLSAARAAGHHIADLLGRIAFEVGNRPLGNQYVVERLLELLCLEALRIHLNSETVIPQGWFNGLKDPLVGRAMAVIHRQPETMWSVDKLARLVAISSSRFSARFVAVVGQSPMAYVTQWRMSVASRLLHHSQQSIASIAVSVGYQDVSAFNRAFKRVVGVSPAAWRSSKGGTKAK